MALTDIPEERNRTIKLALAAIAGLAGIRALRRGNRVRGVLGTLGAVALGYTALSDSERGGEAVDIEATGAATTAAEDGAEAETAGESEVKLRCAACGEPIRPGQRRGPDEHDRTVHEACLQASA